MGGNRGDRGCQMLAAILPGLVGCAPGSAGLISGDLLDADGALDRKVHEVRKALRDVASDVQVKSIYGEGFAIRN